MGFKSFTNTITNYFNTQAEANNWTVRYDNDPRTTPTSGLWFELNIEFGDSNQKTLGIQTYRNFGNVVIKIRKEIGLGLSDLLEAVDIVSSLFKSKNLSDIVFRVPSIDKKGRMKDNYQINVICPFYIDN